MPGLLFWLCLPLHLMLNLVEVLHFARHGQFQVIKRSKLDAIRQLPRFGKKTTNSGKPSGQHCHCLGFTEQKSDRKAKLN
jgi:hypothetical protein